MKIKKILYVIIFIFLFPILSFADGIMIEHIPLYQFFYNFGGVSLVITVTEINKDKEIIKGKIERIITKKSTDYKLNNEYEFINEKPPQLIKGKWYVYETYWNKYKIKDIKKNMKIIVFPDYNKESVFIPHNDKTINKLELFIKNDWKIFYEDNTLNKTLIKNLSDPDLFNISYDICKKKNLLNNNLILDSFLNTEPILKNIRISDNVLQYHHNTLNDNEKNIFYKDVIKKYAASKNNMLFYFLNNYLAYGETDINNFEIIISFYFSNTEFTERIMQTKVNLKKNLIKFLKEDENKKYSYQLNDLVLDYYKNTPEKNYSYNSDLDDFIELLDNKSRILFIKNLSNNITKTKIAENNENNFDEYLAERLLYSMKQYPDIDYIIEIKQLEPYLHIIDKNLIREIITVYKEEFPENINDIKSLEDMINNYENQ